MSKRGPDPSGPGPLFCACRASVYTVSRPGVRDNRIKQEQVSSGQFQQQDLEAGLLASRQRVEGLLGAGGQFVSDRASGSPPPGRTGPVLIAPVQDLQQRASSQLRMVVGLHEPTWTNSSAEPGPAGMGHWRDSHVMRRPMLELRIAACRRCRRPSACTSAAGP